MRRALQRLRPTWASACRNNIFNVKPTKQHANETDNGFIDDSVQFGLNGASYDGRLHVTF